VWLVMAHTAERRVRGTVVFHCALCISKGRSEILIFTAEDAEGFIDFLRSLCVLRASAVDIIIGRRLLNS
jgi:hypothetical protein